MSEIKIFSMELAAKLASTDGYYFKVNINNAGEKIARFCITCLHDGTDKVKNTVFTELKAAECRVLAHMFRAIAIIIGEENLELTESEATFSTLELMCHSAENDPSYGMITVGTGMRGASRTVIEMKNTDTDDNINSQGVDLVSDECNALADMCDAAATIISG